MTDTIEFEDEHIGTVRFGFKAKHSTEKELSNLCPITLSISGGIKYKTDIDEYKYDYFDITIPDHNDLYKMINWFDNNKNYDETAELCVSGFKMILSKKSCTVKGIIGVYTNIRMKFSIIGSCRPVYFDFYIADNETIEKLKSILVEALQGYYKLLLYNLHGKYGDMWCNTMMNSDSYKDHTLWHIKEYKELQDE